MSADLPEKNDRRRIRYIIILIIIGVLIVAFVTPYLTPPAPVSKEHAAVNRALNYFVNNFDFTIGLIRQQPGSNAFWLYSDNYLVALAIERGGQGNQSLVNLGAVVYIDMDGYLATLSPELQQNQYKALNSTSASFSCSSNVYLHWSSPPGVSNQSKPVASIGTTANVGSPYCARIPSNYADLLFLQAIMAERRGNTTAALRFYNAAAADFDGRGIVDRAYSSANSSSYNQYQTYKLALYVYSTVCLGQNQSSMSFVSAKQELLGLQNPATGGFITGYAFSSGSGSNATASSVNTETTALAALALEAYSSPASGC